MKKLTKNSIKKILQPRKASSHKGSHGHALLIAGSMGKMGAAVIAARACLRSGCGLLTINIPYDERFILQTTIPEAMLAIREKDVMDFSKFSAAGIGPGIGTTKDSAILLKQILSAFNKQLITDADALNIIAADKILLDKLSAGTILTPHPKEFDRLFGNHTSTESRMNKAIEKAKEYNIVIVLKGHHTLITNGAQSFLNTTGNAGLAKGGSGDALTGIVCSFLAQGYKPLEAAAISVYLHGLAADITLKSQSMESMLITDVIECLGEAFTKVIK